MPFTKYQDQGAYHWARTYPRKWYRASPRDQARYTIPLLLLSRYLDVRQSLGADLGCGDGVMPYKVSRLGGRMLGLDLDAVGLALARSEPLSRGGRSSGLVRGTCYSLPFRDGSLDYVTAIEVIEHLREPEAFLQELNRVLRPGGVFVCTTPNRLEHQHPTEVCDHFHEHEYTAAELEETLRACFRRPQVYGACPEWLDRVYVGGTGLSVVDKGLRLLFKVIARAVNPYVRAIVRNPDHRWRLLVGVACK